MNTVIRFFETNPLALIVFIGVAAFECATLVLSGGRMSIVGFFLKLVWKGLENIFGFFGFLVANSVKYPLATLVVVLSVFAAGIWALIGLQARHNGSPAQATLTAAQATFQSQTQVAAAITQTAVTVENASLQVAVTGMHTVTVESLAVFSKLPETNNPAQFDQSQIIASVPVGALVNVVGWTSHNFSSETVGGVQSGDFLVAQMDDGRQVYVFAGMISGGYTTDLGQTYKFLPYIP